MSLDRKKIVMLLQDGKSQQEIARQVGTTQPHVSNWLNGTRFPNSQNLKKLADVLNISTQELAEKLSQIAEMS